MDTVSVSELKARLSHYLRVVKQGGEVQVLDRGIPVARLAPVNTEGDDTRERLVAAGVLRPGIGGSEAILGWVPVESGASVLEALLEDREDRV